MDLERVRIDLRRLILLFVILVALATLANSFYAAYRVQRQELATNAMEHNSSYAAKVASSIDELLRAMQQKLAYSASLLGDNFENPDFTKSEVKRLIEQDPDFNSITIVNADGKILNSLPTVLDLAGRTLDSTGAQEALKARRPLISNAYRSISGTLAIFISSPIHDANGKYLGFVGGSIYLKEPSALNRLLGLHFYHDSTYAYVVDKTGRIIYHPTTELIGRFIPNDPAVRAALGGQNGSMQLVNFRGIEMLSGYAVIPSAGWGIVSQQPLQKSLEALNRLIEKMLLGAAPLGALGLLSIWWLSILITRPLQQLAESATNMDDPASTARIKNVHSWYFEAAHIKTALLKGIALMHDKLKHLNTQAQTDPLTGLLNRRAMDEALSHLQLTERPFSVIALDIDHFKKVNDTYGHDAGDLALGTLANIIKKNARDGDLACRIGGEEFILLLPETSLLAAIEVGDRLRREVEHSPIEKIGHVTISLGVTYWPADQSSIPDTLKEADELMYQAKQLGRNRLMAPSDGSGKPE